MTKEFNSLEEIEEYYDEKSNTYIFREDGQDIDLVVFNFDLKITANIFAVDIKAHNIKTGNIDALNIKVNNIYCGNIDALNIEVNNIYCDNIEALNIEALDINYFAVCFAYNNIKCKSIIGRRENAKHFVLDGKLEVEE